MTYNTNKQVFDFSRLPDQSFGGGQIGRMALRVAIDEMKAGAREIGHKNSGPWVLKYLNGLAEEGSLWCAAFISYCFANSGLPMPFNYTVGARELLNQFQQKKWNYLRSDNVTPEPGDIVVWWRGKPKGWQGHVGFVHHFHHETLYTIEGNRTSKVDGFTYNFKNMKKLLGFGRVPEIL